MRELVHPGPLVSAFPVVALLGAWLVMPRDDTLDTSNAANVPSENNSSNNNNNPITVAILCVVFISCWQTLVALLLRWFRRHQEKDMMAQPPLREEDMFPRQHLPDDKCFPKFTELGEDVMAQVLSFVADAPFEEASGNSSPKTANTNNNHHQQVAYVSTLTHALPLVSHQFRAIANSNELWRVALIRQVINEPSLWERGLKQFSQQHMEDEAWTNTWREITQSDQDRTALKIILQDLLLQLESLTQTNSKALYQSILNTQIRFQGPVFYMGHPVQLGKPYGLHFFEPRYRLLMAQVMQGFPEAARRGDEIVLAENQAPPTFIHAHVYPMAHNSPACIVQVVRCRIDPQIGTADVFLVPVAYIRMERIWEQPNSGHLYHAQARRLGREESLRLDQLQRNPYRGPPMF